ncbi:hypothetical protein GO986_08935 [Deinococcus sp. HMF7620]|uniref:Uncharacterized protein n=1 Tax=Deinococcus arboris TaxID=2682977 RepID=A0A7C9HYC9_9DEIO|nr:hypothetical protein [Deinococcus arboris]MVN86888.1 hypothetical protein [Deinococcus arboris]
MGRIEQVLSVMRTDPTRLWAPAEVSREMKTPPAVANSAMTKLMNRGQLVRPQNGQYRLATPDERAAHLALPPEPVVAQVPARPVPRPPVDDIERELLMGQMRAQGRPVSSALLAGRLRRCGFNLARTDDVLADCLDRGLVRRLDDGRHEVAA